MIDIGKKCDYGAYTVIFKHFAKRKTYFLANLYHSTLDPYTKFQQKVKHCSSLSYTYRAIMNKAALTRYRYTNRSLFSVADPDRDPVLFDPWIRDVQKIRIWIRYEQPGSYFSEPNQFFGLQYLYSLMCIRDPGLKKFESGIRDGKKSDPGSGMFP